MLRLGRDENGNHVSGLGPTALATQPDGGLVNPSDSSDSEDTSGTRRGTPDVDSWPSEVDPGVSAKLMARRGCKCLPAVLIIASLVCELEERLRADETLHPGI
jgi:hypothetical protein